MALAIDIEDLLNKQKIESSRIEFKKGWNPAKKSQLLCLQLEKLPLSAEHALEMVSFC